MPFKDTPQGQTHYSCKISEQCCDCFPHLDCIYITDENRKKIFEPIIDKANKDQRDLVKKYEHKIGEHGAVGYLTKNGRICSECNQLIDKL